MIPSAYHIHSSDDQIGKICIEKENIHSKLEKLFLIGTVLLFAGYLFSYGCPINKKIWSPTYVFMTCGAGILLSLLIWIIDIPKISKRIQTFFTVYGVNPLFCYTAGELLFIALIHISIGETHICIHGIISMY